MPDRRGEPTEVVIDLAGRSLGDANAQLVDVAAKFGYSVAVSAPGTYRLARTRRKLFGKSTESLVVRVFESRTGPMMRVVGPAAPDLVAHLRSVPTLQPSQVASPPVSPTDQIAAPVAVPLAATMPSPRTMDFDATVLRAQRPGVAPAGDAWTVVTPDGRRSTLSTPIVVGRNPAPYDAAPGAQLMSLSDPALSKSHVLIEGANGGAVVTDLHSTNGTSISLDGVTRHCEPMQPVACCGRTLVRVGNSILEIGPPT